MPDKQRAPKVGHTPGPWVLAEDYDLEDDEHFVVLAKRRANYRGLKGLWPICLVGYALDLEDDKKWLAQCRANACLIAAAPEMLEALEASNVVIGLAMQIARGDLLHELQTAFAANRAAIAKATGGAQ